MTDYENVYEPRRDAAAFGTPPRLRVARFRFRAQYGGSYALARW
jgi:hypothetical protein